MAIEVLLLHTESAMYSSISVHTMPERPVLVQEATECPGAPALELAFRSFVQIGTGEQG